MSCDTLNASLGQSPNPAGSLGTVAAMAGDGLCRAYTFPTGSTPPPASGIVTFAGDDMVTFAGDALAPF